MSWHLDHYRKYPFAATPSDFPHLFVENPLVTIASNSYLAEKFISTLNSIIKESKVDLNLFRDYEESILVYYALLELVKLLKDKRLVTRLALVYAKASSGFFEKEDENTLLLIGVKTGLRVVHEHYPPKVPYLIKQGKKESFEFKPLRFALPVNEYVRVVSKRLIHDTSYSLSNNVVSKGYVYLDRQTYQRILEEHIFNYVLQLAEGPPEVHLDKVSGILKMIKESVLDEYYKMFRKFEKVEGTMERPIELEEAEVIESLYPPCIKRIIDIVNAGGNPSHLERFTLATFLGQIGLAVDEILEYFKKTADYDEKIARYQVEHVLGLRGSRKKYMPHGCNNLKAAGVCPVAEQCPGGRNPVSVYRYTIRMLRKRKTSNNNAEVASRGDTGEGKAAGGI